MTYNHTYKQVHAYPNSHRHILWLSLDFHISHWTAKRTNFIYKLYIQTHFVLLKYRIYFLNFKYRHPLSVKFEYHTGGTVQKQFGFRECLRVSVHEGHLQNGRLTPYLILLEVVGNKEERQASSCL